jgi:CRISPR/Cas system-associated exonuclease Cas4 (RecB family)
MGSNMIDSIDSFELVRAEELLLGYAAWWADDGLRVLGVEQEFDAPLINPETGAPSKTFRLGGKLDVVVANEKDDVFIMEHKSSSENLDEGSIYWKRLSLDTQIGTYLVGSRSLGYNPKGVLYDVLGKPQQRPKLATPEAERKYTQPSSKACPECKKKKVDPPPHVVDGLACKDGRIVTDPGGRLYANMRATDETPDEFRLRLRAEIEEKPEKYFVRGHIVRLEDEERESAFDVWQEMKRILEGRRLNRYPRNPDSCVRYSQLCTFWPVCSGTASLEDQTQYRIAQDRHEELSKSKVSLPLLTNSELASARACARMHYYRYDLGYRAVRESEVRRFGTLIHYGLEAYWRARQKNVSLVEQVQAGLDVMRGKRVVHEREDGNVQAGSSEGIPVQGAGSYQEAGG